MRKCLYFPPNCLGRKALFSHGDHEALPAAPVGPSLAFSRCNTAYELKMNKSCHDEFFQNLHTEGD